MNADSTSTIKYVELHPGIVPSLPAVMLRVKMENGDSMISWFEDMAAARKILGDLLKEEKE